VGSPAKGWGVAAIGQDGKVRDLTARSKGNQPWPRVWGAVSTPDAIVVGQVDFLAALGQANETKAEAISARNDVAVPVALLPAN
jgi:hypothetical protein